MDTERFFNTLLDKGPLQTAEWNLQLHHCLKKKKTQRTPVTREVSYNYVIQVVNIIVQLLVIDYGHGWNKIILLANINPVQKRLFYK